MTPPRVQYVDCTATDVARVYRLVVHLGEEAHEYTVTLPIESFARHHLGFQDGPEVCYLKLQRALAESDGALPARGIEVTDAELEEYRAAHAPRTSRR